MLLYRALLDLASCVCQNCHLKHNTKCRAYNKVSVWELKPNRIMTLKFQFSMKYNHLKHDAETSDDWQINALRAHVNPSWFLPYWELSWNTKVFHRSILAKVPKLVYLTLSALTLNFWTNCMGGCSGSLCCSWSRHRVRTVPLSTQEYKWVPAKCVGKVMLGIPSDSLHPL